MRIAIVHFHLRGGGVTRVIANTLAALTGEEVQIAVLTGEPSSHPALVDCTKLVAGLAYTEEFSTARAEQLHRALAQAAVEKLGGPPDIWHVHNHNLGKNVNLLPVLGGLARQGACLLLQLHDFPEDGRPLSYLKIRRALPGDALSEALYPQANRVHYAVLNKRDFDFMRKSGAGTSRLHLLPNALGADRDPAEPPAGPKAKQRVLYLTRAIRRKNLGEFLLWSAVSPADTEWATSLAPQNPLERKIYDRWVSFAARHQLPVQFEVGGHDISFTALMASADYLISTSMAEGFGLAFLEPWLYGKPLIGRDLPEVTGSFAEADIDLSHLYERLEIPQDWIDREVLFNKVTSGLTAMYEAYQRDLSEAHIHRALQSIIREGRVDFGRLDEAAQEQVIWQLLDDPHRQRDIRPSTLMAKPDAARMAGNRKAIRDQFSLAAYGKRLMHIYTGMVACEPGACARLDTDRLLDCYLQPERFCLIRS